MRSSRSLEGNTVPPKPVVHRSRVASDGLGDFVGLHSLLVVHLAETVICEGLAEEGSTRPNLGAHLPKPFRDSGLPNSESPRHLRDVKPGFVDSSRFSREFDATGLSHRSILPLHSSPARDGLWGDVGLLLLDHSLGNVTSGKARVIQGDGSLFDFLWDA